MEYVSWKWFVMGYDLEQFKHRIVTGVLRGANDRFHGESLLGGGSSFDMWVFGEKTVEIGVHSVVQCASMMDCCSSGIDFNCVKMSGTKRTSPIQWLSVFHSEVDTQRY